MDLGEGEEWAGSVACLTVHHRTKGSLKSVVTSTFPTTEFPTLPVLSVPYVNTDGPQVPDSEEESPPACLPDRVSPLGLAGLPSTEELADTDPSGRESFKDSSSPEVLHSYILGHNWIYLSF